MNSGIGPLSMETTAPSGIPITGDEECLKVSDWSNIVCAIVWLVIGRILSVRSFG